MRRRQLLTATAIGIAGIAGCSSDSGGDRTATGNGTDAGTETPTPAPTETESTGGGADLSSPEATVQTFYDTLYGDDDIEATNGLYLPESEAPELTPEDFEDFGGVGQIQSDVQSTEVVSQSDGRARVHAEVAYTTPAGSATDTDWFVVRNADGEWLVSLWLPASARDGMSEEEAEGAMQQA